MNFDRKDLVYNSINQYTRKHNIDNIKKLYYNIYTKDITQDNINQSPSISRLISFSYEKLVYKLNYKQIKDTPKPEQNHKGISEQMNL